MQLPKQITINSWKRLKTIPNAIYSYFLRPSVSLFLPISYLQRRWKSVSGSSSTISCVAFFFACFLPSSLAKNVGHGAESWYERLSFIKFMEFVWLPTRLLGGIFCLVRCGPLKSAANQLVASAGFLGIGLKLWVGLWSCLLMKFKFSNGNNFIRNQKAEKKIKAR